MSKSSKTILVTGSLGKTTVSKLIANIYQQTGKVVALFNDMETIIGTDVSETTDFESAKSKKDVKEFLGKCKANSPEIIVIESDLDSSIDVTLKLTKPDIIVVTNLDGEDVKYKVKEMTEKIGSETIIILNRDDEQSGYFVRYFDMDRVFTFGTHDESMARITKGDLKKNGSTIALLYKDETYEIKTKLIGKYHAVNCTTAAACAIADKVNSSMIKRGISKTKSIKGQLEKVTGKEVKPTVLIDSAGTTKQLESSLKELRQLFDGSKIISVIGASGNSDPDTWPETGLVASEHSDIVVITDNEPHDEDPLKIVETVRAGIPDDTEIEVFEEVNRKKAINLALSKARYKDLVYISGLGYRSERTVLSEKFSWDDKEVVKEFYKK